MAQPVPSDSEAPAGGRPRRSPAGTERKRDPERTRARILDAALVEFSEHGYAGARVSAIAARAGVNQQLISYYFDGKAGLFRALSAQWRSINAELSRPELPLYEVVGNYLSADPERRRWARILAWEGLTGSDEDPDAANAFFTAMVDDLRRRQEAGELSADLDPAYVLVALFAAAGAPSLLPQVVHRITGEPPDSERFLETYRDQLRRIIGHLAG